jgi:TatD DNase family protein
MQIIDSHCHLNILKKKQGIAETLAEAKQNCVVGMLNISVDLETADEVIKQSELQSNIWASVGVHPCHCPIEPMSDGDFESIKTLSNHPNVIAIGETGLDFFHTKPEDSQHQFDYFIKQVELSKMLDYPVIIHCRNARTEVIEILQSHKATKGVMHCFAEDWQTAKAALDLGFYISFSGILTYPKSIELKEVAKQVPEERLLVETDSPYLSPQPFRSKYNQPAYVKHTLAHLAELRGTEVTEMAKITTQNFERCFNVKVQSSLVK